jgi:hypothetical protein
MVTKQGKQGAGSSGVEVVGFETDGAGGVDYE